MPKKIEIREYPDVSAMDCWHYIAPLIPVNGDPMSKTIYVNTFHAFKLLEKEEPNAEHKITNRDRLNRMSNQELAIFMETATCSYCCAFFGADQCEASIEHCIEGRKRWLDSEYKEPKSES